MWFQTQWLLHHRKLCQTCIPSSSKRNVSLELSPQEVRGSGKVSVTDLVVATLSEGSSTEQDAD